MRELFMKDLLCAAFTFFLPKHRAYILRAVCCLSSLVRFGGVYGLALALVHAVAPTGHTSIVK